MQIEGEYSLNQEYQGENQGIPECLWELIYFQAFKLMEIFNETIVLPEFGDKSL